MPNSLFAVKDAFRRYWPEITAIVAVLAASIGIVAHAWLLPDSRAYLGFVQTDQPVYYACAREYFENGNGLFAANPYSDRPDSPRLYSHLYFLLVGWIWKLTGLSFSFLDGAVRLLLAPIFLLLAARIFRTIHGWGLGANPLLALMLLGGGLAWFGALFTTPIHYVLGILGSHEEESHIALLLWLLRMEWMGMEGGYADWHVQLFRNFFYSTEVFYHVLFFGTVLLLLRGRWGGASLGVFLTWWAHPYTGLELALIVGLWLLVERIRGAKEVTPPLVAVTAITIMFLAYYGIYLNADPEHKSVYEQMRAFSARMLLSKIIPAYGLLPILAGLAFVKERFRTHWEDRHFRFLTCWALVATFLNFHDHIVPSHLAMQALHFSHGYLYTALALLAPYGLRWFVEKWRPAQAPHLLPRVAVILMLLHLPDNVLWTVRSVGLLPRRCIVFAPLKDTVALMQELDRLPTTETIALLNLPPHFCVVTELIPVVTHHRSVFSHIFNTPHAREKETVISELRTSPTAELLRKLGATAVLIDTSRTATLQRQLGPALGETLLEFKGASLLRVMP